MQPYRLAACQHEQDLETLQKFTAVACHMHVGRSDGLILRVSVQSYISFLRTRASTTLLYPVSFMKYACGGISEQEEEEHAHQVRLNGIEAFGMLLFEAVKKEILASCPKRVSKERP